MNRTDRLLALVLELRLRKVCRAEDLAAAFGISKRTIYRDLDALAEMGVPIVVTMGEGYSLAEGYFLPPLAFTEEEAVVALLGLGAIRKSFDAEYTGAVQRTEHKIRAILGDTLRERVTMLENSLQLVQLVTQSADVQHTLRILRRAILFGQTIQFRYFSRHPDDGKVSLRLADPYTLVSINGIWYMNGYCHLRQDIRMFRLSRMEMQAITGDHFERPPDYSWREEHERDNRTLMVRLMIAEDVLPWVMEDGFYYIEDRQTHPDGVLVTLRVRHIDEIVQWVLGWGRQVRVLEPPELRQRVREEAAAMLKQHESDS
jgi:predicted DNA-binding transcriptional regulator YafY